MAYDTLHDVWYLYIRATKLYLRNPILIFFSLFQPIIFLVLFTQLFSNISSFPGFPPGSYLQFAMAGIILQNAFIGALQSGTSIVDDLSSGFLSKMLVTPVNRIAILLGRLLSDATRMIIQSTIIIVLALLLGATIVTGVAGFLLILFTIAFFGIAWAGISLAIGLRTKRAETVTAIGAFLTFPLLFMSTALVSNSFLPAWMQSVSQFNPITYGVNAVRALTSTGFDWNTILQAYAVIGLIAIVTLGTTLYLFRKVVR